MAFSTIDLWAKTDQKEGTTHPLIYHLIDTAQVFLQFWQDTFENALQDQFCRWLLLEKVPAGRLLAFWAALHDIGKASPVFQQKYPIAVPALEAGGLLFPQNYQEAPHGLVTAWALEDLLPQTGLSRTDTKLLGRALAGHHGSFPLSTQIVSPAKHANLGGASIAVWQSARQELFDTLCDLLQPPTASLPANVTDRNAFLMLFSGAVTSADWVASMENCFPYTLGLSIEDYWENSRQKAEEAIQMQGFSGWRPDGSALDFQAVFEFPPNEVQTQLLKQAGQAVLPALLVVEAPTGCGKTEAALAVADQWLQSSGGRGLYVAMPTTATSNQMFGRVKEKYLERRYPNIFINLQLAHGSAALDDNLEKMILRSVGEDTEAGVAAMGWFLPKKRTLLASFAVGTVDQALLSVLQSRHFFVRLFGLGGKVLIFDEVHAYDTYMSEIFCRLLQWLRAAGVSVILLSATLPEETRKRFAGAYSSIPQEPSQHPSPRFTLASSSQNLVEPLPFHHQRRVNLEWCGASPADVAEVLRARIENGGCAAVVCNTVRRAQEVFAAVQTALICPSEDCYLFHARFPFEDRQNLEARIVDVFGKEPKGERPKRSIVVATQVIEQSLDLDFDLLISDMAPIDLLIQRAGRLHRHNRNMRPQGLEQPTLIICQLEGADDDAPEFGGSRFVYEPYILLRTLAALQGRDAFHVPADTTELIEKVYSPLDASAPQPYAELLEIARKKMEGNDQRSHQEANARLVLPPDDAGVIKMENLNLEDENPKVHASLQALTRLGSRSVSLICVHRQADGALNTRLDGSGFSMRKGDQPDHKGTKAMLRASISIQHPSVVNAFLDLEPPAGWKKSSALRFHRLAVFENGVCQIKGIPYLLKLDPTLGLLIEKEV